MFSCLPFLFKSKANAQAKPVEVQVKQEPVEQDPITIDEVPQVVRLRYVKEVLCIPPELMNIRNPQIKADLKKFCMDNNLCVACSYANPGKPTVLLFNGILYECPNCDSDVDSQ